MCRAAKLSLKNKRVVTPPETTVYPERVTACDRVFSPRARHLRTRPRLWRSDVLLTLQCAQTRILY